MPSVPCSRELGNAPASCILDEHKNTRNLRVATVLWSGRIGGAETVSVSLTSAMRKLGADASVVFIGNVHDLRTQLQANGTPWVSLGMEPGSRVMLHPSLYSNALAHHGAHGAILSGTGFMAGLLRVAGYRSPLVGVEHGGLLQEDTIGWRKRVIRRLDRALGLWALDAHVAVSDFMLAEVRRRRHGQRTTRIYNGIDTDQYSPAGASVPKDTVTIGAAGRLIAGKGFDVLVRAVAAVLSRPDAPSLRVLLAGSGPEEGALARLIDSSGIGNKVNLVGKISDMPAFWRSCDLAVIPSTSCVESFGMCALEAMSTGIPVVATCSGALPEIVLDGVCGRVIPCGDEIAMANAISDYAKNDELRSRHGARARSVVRTKFGILTMARQYLELLADCAVARCPNNKRGGRS